MKYWHNEKGMALVMSLILAVVCLSFSAALIYMITQGTRMSGLEGRYATCLDAARGGLEVMTNIIDRGGDFDSSATLSIDLSPDITEAVPTPPAPGSQEECFRDHKLKKSTDQWNDNDNDPSTPVLATPCMLPYAIYDELNKVPVKDVPDITMVLGSSPDEYNIYLKIVDTVEGNSPVSRGGGGGGRDVSAVVEGGGAIEPPHMPFLYTIDVLAERATSSEKSDSQAQITALYAH